MKLIDTHCDTALEILRRNESIVENTRHISLNKASVFESYAQFFALWACEDRSDEESYEEFLRMSDNMQREIRKRSSRKNRWNQSELICLIVYLCPLRITLQMAGHCRRCLIA